MPTVGELLYSSARRLEAITDTPRLDAEILLARALNMPRARLLASLHESVSTDAFEHMVQRRLNAEPIAYILGEWEFYGLALQIEPPVLVPRPETEHLVSTVVNAVGKRGSRVLEIGTGSGCVSVAIATHAPNCQLVATDVRLEYVQLARRNAERHEVDDRIAFRYGDLFEGLGESDWPFDIICANPPYVADSEWDTLSPVIRLHEDPGALLGGADGLDVVHRLVAETRDFLKPRGMLAMEIGSGHFDTLHRSLDSLGYEHIQPVRDLAGINRVITARLPAA